MFALGAEGAHDFVTVPKVGIGPNGLATAGGRVLGEFLDCGVFGGGEGGDGSFAARCSPERIVVEAGAPGCGLKFGTAKIERPGLVADETERGKGRDPAEALEVIRVGRGGRSDQRGGQHDPETPAQH